LAQAEVLDPLGMSGSTEPQMALVFPEDLRTTIALITLQRDSVGSEELKEVFI